VTFFSSIFTKLKEEKFKKLFLITVLLSFFISSVSYSKIITLKDCYTDTIGDKSFKDLYEDFKFVIDTDTKVLTQIVVWSDKVMKERDENRKKNKDEGLGTEHYLSPDKLNISSYKIDYIDNDYVTAEWVYDSFRTSINVFLQKKTVSYTIEDKESKLKTTSNIYCE